MKKTVIFLLLAAVGIFLLSGHAFAAPVEEEEYYGDLWEQIDGNTKALLEDLGIGRIASEDLLSLSPFRIFTVIRNVAAGEAVSPVRYGGAALLALALTSLVLSLLPEGAMRSRCETVGHLALMATLLAGVGAAMYESIPAVTATKDFMVLLVPVLTGIIGFSGNPALAVSWGGAVLAFAETVTAAFARYAPAAASLGTAVCAAANLNAETDLSGAAKVLCKTVTSVMAFCAGVFSAVLAVKDVIASAADSVSLKGAKFLIGQGIPIVGGAVADALNTVAAGLSLVRDTLGIFAVVALFLIVLVPLIRLFLWKLVFRFIGMAAGLLGQKRAVDLTESFNSLLTVILAVICFNSVVFIVSVALVVRIAGR